MTHPCPVCHDPIPDQKYLCNPDASHTPDALVVTLGIAVDTGNLAAQQLTMAAIISELEG